MLKYLNVIKIPKLIESGIFL
uniref:Uncharacterized protein n=1 Tax=Lepeophtheirus salmonis TaxID=72036 RepID=A0A0K2TNH1_LEPSM